MKLLTIRSLPDKFLTSSIKLLLSLLSATNKVPGVDLDEKSVVRSILGVKAGWGAGCRVLAAMLGSVMMVFLKGVVGADPVPVQTKMVND